MMSCLPLSEAIAQSRLQSVRLVATDMDGTLTCNGQLSGELLEVLEALRDRAIATLIVTGRSAGWVNGLSQLLPIAGAIAENGGIFYAANGESTLLTPIVDLPSHRQQLAAVFAELQRQFPDLCESSDNPFRLTDWTFDVQGLTTRALHSLKLRCRELGWDFTYSSVQCHIRPLGQDKAKGLLSVLSRYFPDHSPDCVVTVGDSPNDESLFDPHYFQLSVGVANVLDYTTRLTHQPAYVTGQPEGWGFCELARALVASD
ncbi:HAD-IIB family hydrolase [Oxynema aestuarii AP17]|uniref:HAD-IIB family hydrolase n=2 Tax=Oxynema TaxID=1492710 RepID=A0A6H1U4V0_9CYAN|nr:HAD-IIB family hydrolase [Oxynema aestuarii AP17]RMH74591.1 MAG: HAD-IIB family hydrolase [Cyanobacteria bacterium J007]